MTDSPQITPRILVTTDFSDESEKAFFHALAVAVRRQARLTLLHTGSESRHAVPWERFPGVRETLNAWQLLPADAPRTAVAETLNVVVAKMAMRDDDPRQGITEYIRKHPTDLLVMATEGGSGLVRLFNPSVAETASYLTKSFTLMLPKQGSTFIDPATGSSRLRKVLCALDPAIDPRATLAYLGQWLPALADEDRGPVHVTYLDAGNDDTASPQAFPIGSRLQWHRRTLQGDLVEGLAEAALEDPADLVVMHAVRPMKLLGRIRGSHIDRVLKELKLPLLSVPRR